MIIVAYVMGLTLSRTDLNHVIREKLHPVYVFLVPVFFTVMGMLVDVRLLASKEVLLFGLLYTFVAALAKIIGCGVPALFVNFNLRGALRIGAGMLPRGEVTLIIAGTGLAAGLLNPKIFGVVVFMTFCAALLAPPTLVHMFKSPKSGLRRPVKESDSSELVFSFPSFMAAELLVGKLLTAFESEGFFVHTLSRAERLYQLRQEGIVIAFQHRDKDIIFDVNKTEIPFVNTAMVEVVAELERTIQELKKPLDIAELSRRIQEADGAVHSIASLQGYLRKGLLVADLKGSSKEAIIDELLEVLHRSGYVMDIADARKAVLGREASMSTGMQFGVAIPHGRTDSVDKLVCAIGIKTDGVELSPAFSSATTSSAGVQR